ncbi:SDR family NAD(P)-dependent oxidoreductase [Acetobacterium tundrae]|uniref:Glucose 1-dehydrogenase n=1 Tax=Acetobacterium tundrae TaxID=132932 RepID=A0ABR6WKE7_9FIRM|nr:SDR family NAD(P)-dependent oxidoreductase [Acetobacterium tundrae]MBC3796988.1 glucose 1-dehydrogenase [Acetobacterium tundrae]
MVNISLKDKVVIVTGAARGIGRAIALKMAEAECKGLVVNDLRIDDHAKSLKKEAEAYGTEVLLIAGDMSNEEDVKKMINAAVDEWGRLDVMVNNAGISKSNDLFGTSASDWDLVININMRSAFLGTKYAAAYMKDHGGGTIVNMGSIAGITGGNTSPDYGASKAGIIALTKYAAKFLAPYGIRVNALAPGTIYTDMIKRNFENLTDEAREQRLSAIPMGRMGDPDEVATAALFFASDLSSFITGDSLMITGGRNT